MRGVLAGSVSIYCRGLTVVQTDQDAECKRASSAGGLVVHVFSKLGDFPQFFVLLKIIHDKPGCVFTDNSSAGEQTGEQTWSMHTVRVVGIGQMALSGVSSWQVILYIHNHFSKLSHVRTGVWVSHRQGEILSSYKYHNLLASYPGHVGGGKSSLVSTVCACANDFGANQSSIYRLPQSYWTVVVA